MVKKILGLIILAITFGCIFFLNIRKLHKRWDEIAIEYPLIKKTDSINDKVESIYHPEGFKLDPHYLFLELSKNGKRSLHTFRDNEDNDLIYSVNVTSILIKRSGSDTIQVINTNTADTTIQYFIIREEK